MKTIEWKTESGKEVKVNVELKLKEEINLDGDKCTVPCCELEVRTEIKELDFVSFEEPWKRAGLPDGYVAAIGRLIIEEKEYNKINNAIEEAKQHPAWIAKQMKIEANKKAAKEDYETKKRNGYCFKCHSYCYGDCES